jgi:SAM-dependent methyltransferase
MLTASWLKEHGLQAKRVIDIGCGTGLWSIAFALNGSSVTAVDFSTASLSYADKMARGLDVSVTFKRADLFSFQTSERYQLVFCNGVLHHTGNARDGFRRIAQFVEPGGMLAISLYNRLSPFRFGKFLVRGFGRDSIESKRLVAQAIIALPLSKALFTFASRSQPGPFGSAWEYMSRDENLVDLLCHAHTSYHTVWEVKQWYKDEGFEFILTIPPESISGAVLPNLLFYLGRRPDTMPASISEKSSIETQRPNVPLRLPERRLRPGHHEEEGVD